MDNLLYVQSRVLDKWQVWIKHIRSHGFGERTWRPGYEAGHLTFPSVEPINGISVLALGQRLFLLLL